MTIVELLDHIDAITRTPLPPRAEASGEPVAWAVYSAKGDFQYATESETEARSDASLGRLAVPLYAPRPVAAVVKAAEAYERFVSSREPKHPYEELSYLDSLLDAVRAMREGK